MAACEQNGAALRAVPEKYHSAELCMVACKQNGLALGHVLEEQMSAELCMVACKQNGLALEWVPDEYLPGIESDEGEFDECDSDELESEEESVTGPPRRKHSELADAAAMDEDDEQSSEDSAGEDDRAEDSSDEDEDSSSDTAPKQVKPRPTRRKQLMKTVAAKSDAIRKRRQSRPAFKAIAKGDVRDAVLAARLDEMRDQGQALRADTGETLDGDYYLRVMKGRESARKKQQWKDKVKKAAVSVYIALHGYAKSSGGGRRCMHDAAINGAKRLGRSIDRKRLDRECPPRKTKDTSFAAIERASAVAEQLRFEPVNVDNEAGGNEAALMSIEDGGVFLVMSQVDGSQATFHAFVYDSTGTVAGEKPHRGMLIDNRRKKPVYLIEAKDRASVDNKRKCLNDFFDGRVFVMHVWRMVPVQKRGRDDCEAGCDAKRVK